MRTRLSPGERRAGLPGRGPSGVAAAPCISAILCGARRTPREVADVAGVAEAIMSRYTEMVEKLDLDILL